ncbi:iron complex transport system substrate-binding protein [Mumia flava]|uniref:Iron complex transport system substrate-binding protein n=1 Tax=Mumia flava TaxID=1348852 RepID=A0A0B2BE83_9ACTN|nr:ABC transporter substrate-binding protein [Mumia flava]PJJ53728.1 iron complex transport system substrate-binding protein [Mumia flava]
MPRPHRLLALVAALVLALSLAACANDANDDSAAEATEASTRTIEDTFNGTVEGVPTDPQRVVALWRTGSLLADIGVTPVGSLEGEFLEEELGSDLYADYADIPTVGTFEGVDIEKVIELDPDLIIGMDNGGLAIDYDELSEIAPTVILNIAEPTDVWDNYPKVADIVGKSTTFEEQNADLDAQLADIAAEHGDVVGDLQVTSFSSFDGTIWVDTSKSLSYRRLDAAGFGYNPDYTDDPERYVTELSMENIASLADQDIIFYDATLEGEPAAGIQEILDSASFQRLDAAKKGNVFPLTSGVIYTFAGAFSQVEDLTAAAEAYQP